MTFRSPDSGGPRYTHLFACISEEGDGYVVQVRLYHKVKPAHAAWGEEITDSFETASVLIASLAAEAFDRPRHDRDRHTNGNIDRRDAPLGNYAPTVEYKAKTDY